MLEKSFFLESQIYIWLSMHLLEILYFVFIWDEYLCHPDPCFPAQFPLPCLRTLILIHPSYFELQQIWLTCFLVATRLFQKGFPCSFLCPKQLLLHVWMSFWLSPTKGKPPVQELPFQPQDQHLYIFPPLYIIFLHLIHFLWLYVYWIKSFPCLPMRAHNFTSCSSRCGT